KKIKIYLKTLLIFTLTTIICFLGFVILKFNPTYNSDINKLSNKTILYIDESQKIVDLTFGMSHSGMTIDTNNDGFGDELYIWGGNENGQLGYSDLIDRKKPVKLDFFSGQKIIDIDFGGSTSAVTIDTNDDNYGDKLYTWGLNNYGQLGHGNDDYSSLPKLVNFGKYSAIINISLGGEHSAATLDTTGDGFGDELYTWGSNSYGELGLGASSGEIQNKPKQVSLETKKDIRIISISSGYRYMGIIIDSTNNLLYGNKLYTWGYNEHNQSSEEKLEIIWTPNEWENVTGKKLIEFSAGRRSGGLIISSNKDEKNGNELYTWGAGWHGKLGHGDENDINKPTKISSISDDSIISQINMSQNSSTAIINGKVNTWGWNNMGSLGIGDWNDDSYKSSILAPTPINKQLNIVYLKQNSPGFYEFSGYVIDTNNDGVGDELYTWGYNAHGQLGHSPKETFSPFPSKVKVNVKLSIINLIIIILVTLVILIILIILIIFIIKYIKKKNNKEDNTQDLNYFENKKILKYKKNKSKKNKEFSYF
ncbi:MAG: hypothetical protein HRS50_01440, partial [Mycoplasmataceae bacterium]|nr:hypothetical protein [Mycoplasmataceae bacterium]